MQFKPFFTAFILIAMACTNNESSGNSENYPGKQSAISITRDNPFERIKNIPLPAGFTRDVISSDPFATFLRNIPLKKDRTVYLYDGRTKTNQSAQFAVLNVSVGYKDLQQCADAVMRLRAEYQYAAGQFEQILFKDNNGTSYSLSRPFTRDNFDRYLSKVFGMCGSASLSKSLKPAGFADVLPGDVLIHGGFPGHAVIVMDVASNAAGKKIFLLAQSYMPAQDIHVLINPGNKDLSPWYAVNEEARILTPEYIFQRTELKRW